MNLTEEQLKELGEMAGLFFELEDIMINLGIPIHEKEDFEYILEFEKENPIFNAYHKGRLASEVKLRTAINQASLNGSNPAQQAMLDFRKQML